MLSNTRTSKKISNRKLYSISATVVSLLHAVYFTSSSFAINLTMRNGVDSARGTDQPSDLFGSAGIFSTITNVLLFIAGAIAVIMIVIGGIRYVISGGDSTHITAAKNTILYAIVGLIITLLAYAIINFVISSFTGGTPGSGGTSGGLL